MKKLIILAAFAALTMPQVLQAQELELIAGWDTFAFDPANRAPTFTDGTDGTFAVTNASSDNQHMNGQIDGTWGSLSLTPAPSVAQDASTVVSRFVNGNNPSYEFTVNETSGSDRDLGFFVFDGGSFRPRSARTWELSVISGDLTAGVIASGRLDPGSGFVDGVLGIWTNVDVSLSDLADNTLDANGSVVFGLNFTGGGLNDEGEVAVDENGNPLNNGGHHGYLDNVGIGIGQLPDPQILGDFDGDGDVDLADLDQYNGNIGMVATGNAALEALDLDNDGTVGANDFQQHYSELVETSNGQTGTFAGDVNLDGTVNVLGDAFALVGNLNNAATSWSQGDLNADGTVNVLGDAFALVGNLGSSNEPAAAPSASAVPEPGSLSLLALVGMGVVARRRR